MSASPLLVAEMLVATFAGRRDAFNRWTGSQYVAVREPLTAEVAMEALTSGKPVGAYVLPPSNETHVAALDFDRSDGLELARKVGLAASYDDVPAYPEPSREGRAHLWFVASATVPAIVWLRALREWLATAELAGEGDIELRPSTDRLPGADALGQALRLPTMPNPKNGHRYPLCGLDGQPLGLSLGEMLAAVDWARPADLSAVAERYVPPLDPHRLDPADRPPRMPHKDDGASASDILRELWGVPNAAPGKAVRCPAHDDRHPSLSVLADDRRAICFSPSCVLHNDGHGRGTYELTSLAAQARAGRHE